VEPIAPDQPRRLAPAHDLREERLAHGHPEPPPGLGEHRVVRRALVQVVADEPHQGQMQPQLLGQAPLAGDAVQVADQRHLEQHLGVDPRLARPAVEAGRQPPHEGEVDHPGDAAQEVVLRHAVLQAHPMEQLRRERLPAQHDGVPPRAPAILCSLTPSGRLRQQARRRCGTV
jgi:hypothetical protein